jgi:alpha-L-rhamnosidase
MNSFNHQEFASVGEWIYRVILGIEPDESRPGYKHFFIRPRPGGSLTYARGSLHTVRGPIAVDWSRTGGAFTLKVSVPPNTSATVALPADSLDEVTESGGPLTKAEGVSVFDTAAGTVLLHSGTYEFVVQHGSKP